MFQESGTELLKAYADLQGHSRKGDKMHKRNVNKIEMANLPFKEERFRILNDRRRLLNLISEIESRILLLSLKEKQIQERKLQLSSGEIREKDQWGNKKTKSDLESDIQADEEQVANARLQLNYVKEDLFYLLNGQLPGYKDEEIKLEKVKEIVNEHYQMIDSEYKKIKEIFK